MTGQHVLLLENDPAAQEADAALLRGAGFEVELAREPTLALAAARVRPPGVLLTDASLPVLSGREVVRALHAFRETEAVPVVLLADRATPADEARAVVAGAAALWSKPLTSARVAELPRLIAECVVERTRPPAERRAARLASRLAERAVTGTLLANPGTPFEGRVEVSRGAVASATFGELDGPMALTELLGLADASWRFDAAGAVPVAAPNGAAAAGPVAYRPHLLLVDDEEELRKLWSLRLSRSGFQVDTADNGQQGLERAFTSSYDLIVADLGMPVLDGWGMLATLRADPRTSEVPVLVLSAYDDLREGLKAARAGAHDYLTKTGHADVFLRKIRALTTPRQAVWEALERARPLAGVELAAVGPMWLVRAAGRTGASVIVTAEDDFGQYELRCAGGQLIEALALRSAGPALHDAQALLAFGAARAARALVAPWTPGHTVEGPQVENAVDEAQLRLSDAGRRLLVTRVKGATAFEIVPELYALFLGLGAETDVKVLRALYERRVPPERLSAELELPANVVRGRLADLVRRGVLVVSESSPAEGRRG